MKRSKSKAKEWRTDQRRAWALASRMVPFNDEPPWLLGRYCFGSDVPAHFGGYVIGVFATRREAREAARAHGWCRPSVVRVRVTVTVT